jgi:hypothetical protein
MPRDALHDAAGSGLTERIRRGAYRLVGSGASEADEPAAVWKPTSPSRFAYSQMQKTRPSPQTPSGTGCMPAGSVSGGWSAFFPKHTPRTRREGYARCCSMIPGRSEGPGNDGVRDAGRIGDGRQGSGQGLAAGHQTPRSLGSASTGCPAASSRTATTSLFPDTGAWYPAPPTQLLHP